MPVHDWSRLFEDDYRSFRMGWIATIRVAIAESLLSPSQYATIEHRPLRWRTHSARRNASESRKLATQVVGEPSISLCQGYPQTRFRDEVSYSWASLNNHRIGVYCVEDDRLVACIEILTHEHKARHQTLEALHNTFQEGLSTGCHLLVIDLTPAGPHDPRGMHASFWTRYAHSEHSVTAGEPFGIASYHATLREDFFVPSAYYETVAIGQDLPMMPLFLSPDEYINIPLQSTYDEACAGNPRHWKSVLEAPKTS